MPFVSVLGAPAWYREQPAPKPGAPTVLLLHMAGGSSVLWGPVASLMGRACHVVAPDFPGHGRSQPAPLPNGPGLPGVHPRITGFAHWANAFMDALHLEHAVVAGHSMGGLVTLCLARLHRPKVAAMGLVCTAGKLDLGTGFQTALHQEFGAFVASFTAAAGAGQPASTVGQPIFPQAPREEVLADFDAVHGFDAGSWAVDLGLPSLVMAGTLDTLTPPVLGMDLAALLKGRFLIQDGGHLLPRQAPAVVAQALLALCGHG